MLFCFQQPGPCRAGWCCQFLITCNGKQTFKSSVFFFQVYVDTCKLNLRYKQSLKDWLQKGFQLKLMTSTSMGFPSKLGLNGDSTIPLTASPSHHLCILLDVLFGQSGQRKMSCIFQAIQQKDVLWATPVGRSTVGTDDLPTLWKHRWTFPEFVW